MSAELETVPVDAHREVFRHRPRHVHPVGSPCANCEAILQGPWCHRCGQSAEEMHRSVLHLAGEAVEGFTHFDGRFWRTLPPLFLNPGRLTREYIAGHRVAQVPPLRLFLIVLLIVFFAGSLGGRRPSPRGASGRGSVVQVRAATPAEQAQARATLRNLDIRLGDNGGLGRWVEQRATRAGADPEGFVRVLEEWSHRFAFLMLPISALILSVLFVFQRRFYLFDHLIFSMHSLSFQGLLLTPVMLFGGAFGLLLLLSPVHLFFHLRGAYETSIVGTLIRMALLFIASTVAFVCLLVALILVGLNSMGAH